MEHLTIKFHLLKRCNTKQLTFGLRRIDKRTKEIKACWKLQCLAYRTDKLHCSRKQLGMQVNYATLVKRTVQLVEVGRKLYSVLLNNIRSS